MANTLTQPQTMPSTFCANGDKNTIIDTPSASDPQLANFETGFPAVTSTPVVDGGIPPERQDFNGLFNLFSSHLYYLQNGGQWTFNTDVATKICGYPKNAVLAYGARRVVSNIDNNANNFNLDPSYIGDSSKPWSYVDDFSIVQGMLETIYPVGSVYLSVTDTCPIASLFGEWRLVSTGRALWGGNGSNGGTTIDAGLPNITGSLGFSGIDPSTTTGSTSGAFTKSNSQGAGNSHVNSVSNGYVTFSLNASRSSNVYGKSSTVQPPAYVVNAWQRVA